MSGVSGTMDETLPRMRLGIGISSTEFPHDRKSLPDMLEMDGPRSVSPLAMLPPTTLTRQVSHCPDAQSVGITIPPRRAASATVMPRRARIRVPLTVRMQALVTGTSAMS